MLAGLNSLIINQKIPIFACRESASGMLGLSAFGSTNFVIYTIAPVSGRYGHFICIPCDNFDFTETEFVNGIRVTNPARTIREMIKFECSEEFVCQSINWWEMTYGDLSKLEEDLSKNNLLEIYKEKYLPYCDEF